MPRRSVYGSSVEWAGWERAAFVAGENLNGWLRRAANEAAALERALAREREETEDAKVDREAA